MELDQRLLIGEHEKKLTPQRLFTVLGVLESIIRRDVVELVLPQPFQSGDLAYGSDEMVNSADSFEHYHLFRLQAERIVLNREAFVLHRFL